MAQHSNKGARYQLITANRLSDGAVVYFSKAQGWVTTMGAGDMADGEAELAALQAQAEATNEHVVNIYHFEVLPQNDGGFQPVSVRETIRAAGPSIHYV